MALMQTQNNIMQNTLITCSHKLTFVVADVAVSVGKHAVAVAALQIVHKGSGVHVSVGICVDTCRQRQRAEL